MVFVFLRNASTECSVSADSKAVAGAEAVHLVHRQGGLSFVVSETSADSNRGTSGPVFALCGLNEGWSVFVSDGQLQRRRMGQ